MPEDGHAAWAAAGLNVLESIPLRRSADVRGVILQALCECSFLECTTAIVMPIYHRPMEKTFHATTPFPHVPSQTVPSATQMELPMSCRLGRNSVSVQTGASHS